MTTTERLPELPIAVVAAQLGLKVRGRRLGPCPACRADRTKTDRRPPITFEGLGWHCWVCTTSGDGVDLVSFAVVGRRGSEARERFPEVAAWYADRHHVAVEVANRPPEVKPRAPEAELRALFKASTPVAKTRDERVLAFLRGRRPAPIDPAVIPAWVLPPAEHPVYDQIRWWPRTWARTWPLVVPMFTGMGELAGLHARAVAPDAPSKTRWPVGVDCSGLLFADPLGIDLLRGRLADRKDPLRVLVTEGITDFWWAAERAPVTANLAVLGIESGSAPAFKLVRFPPKAKIYVGTDADDAGDEYARQIADALAPRHIARRLPLHLLSRS